MFKIDLNKLLIMKECIWLRPAVSNLGFSQHSASLFITHCEFPLCICLDLKAFQWRSWTGDRERKICFDYWVPSSELYLVLDCFSWCCTSVDQWGFGGIIHWCIGTQLNFPCFSFFSFSFFFRWEMKGFGETCCSESQGFQKHLGKWWGITATESTALDSTH